MSSPFEPPELSLLNGKRYVLEEEVVVKLRSQNKGLMSRAEFCGSELSPDH